MHFLRASPDIYAIIKQIKKVARSKGETLPMEYTDQDKLLGGWRSVDQLINTLDLISCGILNFTLVDLPGNKGALPAPWEQLIAIREKLELTRNLLSKNGAWSSKSERIIDNIKTIATQANWLALDAAIWSAQNGWMKLFESPLCSEIDSLAEDADALASAMVDLFQEKHYEFAPPAWKGTALHNQLIPTYP